ncbi:hypothetical protein [Oceanisphaera arctica]|uniref:Uncharacterized protein n=1 Tax=Oceanisphaera arctica TaxID=641510 RepID=A0A2P5TLX7_9GAMM|nr:hypothetical protein [Oceanisphaera arctica]PPL16387.1 hypothetical protein UN63_09180 [Oceanisphaera arctica]GHA14015.1 hypothetical protein GCM10007082_13630 [Oceanisphaera arctica]
MLLWILLLGLAIGLVLLLVHQGRTQGEIDDRVQELEAENRRLCERVNTLEKLLLEKEKSRPFEELE